MAISKANGQVFDLVLYRYAVERLLYRLSVSAHARRFVLKGATLLMTWLDSPHRVTRDLDLLGFGVPRRTVYYKPTKAAPKLDDRFVAPIKAMIEENPSFGYRTVAHLLGFNKNTVQRVFQIKGRQVRKRPTGARPRIEALPSVAEKPNERWSTDLARVWGGKDGWCTLALVMDCHTRELLGWHLSRSGKATTAASALEHALIARFGTLGKVDEPFLLRSDNGLVFTSRKYTALVKSYGLRQEFITPHCPQQNGMMERLIRSLKEQCVHRQRFESLAHATRAIGDWIQFYNTQRSHQALDMPPPR